MSTRKDFIKNIVSYSIANYLYTAINAVSNIFVSNILGPSANGIISYFNAINSNVDKVVYSTLRSSLERNVPQIATLDEKKRFANHVYTINLYCCIIVSTCFLFYGWYIEEPITKSSAYFMAAFNFIHGFSEFYRTWNRALNKIRMISIIMILVALLIPLFAIYFSKKWGLTGFWSGRVSLQIVALVVFLFFTKEIVHISKLDFSITKKLVASGAEIVVFSFFTSGLQTMDKYFVKGMIGLEDLGYYSVGSMAFTMLMLIPHSVTGAIYPKFLSIVNTNLTDKIRKYSFYIQTICLIIAIAIFYLIPYLISRAMPKYIESIPVIRIFLIAFVSYSSVQLQYIDIIRKKRMKVLIKRTLFVFIVAVCVFILLSFFQPSIETYAWCNVLGFLFLSLSITRSWHIVNNYSLAKPIVDYANVFVPIIVLLPLYLSDINHYYDLLIVLLLFSLFITFNIINKYGKY